MMNLLSGRGFNKTRSPESEGLQQPVEVRQAGDIDHRRAKRHRRANVGIEHPRSDDNRYTWFGLNDNNVSISTPFGVELPDLAAMQRVPAVMDFHILADMGRMNPQWLLEESHGCSAALTVAVSVPQRCTASSSRPR